MEWRKRNGQNVFHEVYHRNGQTKFVFRKEIHMLWTIAVVLLALWALGLVSGYTMGSFIHVLLVIAVIIVLVRVIQGRKVV
jgi:hypothetical protein